MTTFYIHTFQTIQNRLFLVILLCFSYQFSNAQCNPDTTAPVAVCQGNLFLSLPPDGLVTFDVSFFDEGSFDNCCDVTLEIRRNDTTCDGYPDDAIFGPEVNFCCDDIGVSDLFVILQVTDCNDNINVCLTQVTVEDKLPPIVLCPADTAVTCGFWNETLYPAFLNSQEALNDALSLHIGDATAFDNCEAQLDGINQVLSSNTFCQDFTIQRTWIYSDGNPDNGTVSCTHTTSVAYIDAWSFVFPSDITVNDFGMTTPDLTGYPIVDSGSCGLLAYNYEDVVFNDVTGLCAKILRTWTTLNWCSGEIVSEIQTILISGGTPPVITCPENLVVYTDANTSLTNVTLPLPSTQGDISSYAVTATSDLPNFNDVSFSATDVPEGIYSATFDVADLCDSSSVCTFQIEVTSLGNLVCPSDATINCNLYKNDIEVTLSLLVGDSEAQNESLDQFFGTPNFQGSGNISSSVAIDVDACGQGTLIRTWELDNSSNILCTQTITIEYVSDWSVVFPPDSLINCTVGTINAGEPEIINSGCGLFGVAYDDVVFSNGSGNDYLILRTWTTIDWCDSATETHTQTINVNDIGSPIFSNNCNLPDVCLDGNLFSCIGALTIPTPTIIDCTNDVALTVTSDFGDGFGPFSDVEPGFYTVTFSAVDVSGNIATCMSNINVVDCIDPVAVCDVNVTVSLGSDGNGGGLAVLATENIDDGSFDNCSTELTYSFTANTVLSELTLDCGDLGTDYIELFITDEYGNQNSCFTIMTVQDVLDICPPNPCVGLADPLVLACNNIIQVSLPTSGTVEFIFDFILEGIPADCIANLDLSFDSNTDIDVLTFDCSDLGNHTVTVYATNDNGNQTACWGTVVISDVGGVAGCGDPTDCDNDTFPPTVICPQVLIVDLLGINDPNNPFLEPIVLVNSEDFETESFDNCTDDLIWSFSSNTTDSSLSLDCSNIGDNSVELWATDASGNQNFCQTNVFVQSGPSGCDTDCGDNTIPPVAICDANVMVSLSFSGEAEVFTSNVDGGSYDDCSQTVSLSFAADNLVSSHVFSCDDLGDNVLVLYVSDENGNQNQCWVDIVVSDLLNACDNECVNDDIAPEAFCATGLVIQMPFSGQLTLGASIFNVGSTDNCTNDLILTISTINNDGQVISGPATGLPFNANNIGANNILLTVEDAAGNQDECNTILLLQSNPPQVIQGKIFVDDNDDCTYNVGELGLSTWQIKLEAIDDTLATEPGIVVLPPSYEIDAEGNYSITLPDDLVFFTPDSSVVNINNLTPYLRVSLATGFNYGQSCDYNYFINSTTNTLDTVEIDFPVQIIESCPQLSVDISTPYLRRCFDNTYFVNYCNFGNIAEDDASIEIEFDEFLEITSSTFPWTSVDGNIYTFDIGTVAAAECGSFEVEFTVSCDAVLGQTHCTTANIYPDELCDPVPPQWSGASIDITGTCDGEFVRFFIKNVGDEDMNETMDYVVIEDFIMYNAGTFNLIAGESTELVMPASGSTWRIEADQVPFHPGNSKPALAIEGCSVNGTFSLGYVTQFVQNDSDPFVSVNCQENVGSFDPNDKVATVTGYGDEHYIKQNADIEYMIRFQNTGTDTAFNIVVIDTLDINLDPLSVRPGASSHPYDFTILGNNVLKFNFDNIALPDSNVNVVTSQGFIKFRVSQHPDVAIETVIENNAAIYFDFNEPIITNVVFHTIGDHFPDIINATDDDFITPVSIKVFPNPFEEEATVEITGLDLQNGLFHIYDMQGRLMQTFEFEGNKFAVKQEELPSGMYFYQLKSKDGELVNSGKMVIK